jgi:hypothetical protein
VVVENIVAAVVEVAKRGMVHIWDHFWQLGHDGWVEIHLAMLTREDRLAMSVEVFYVGPKRDLPEMRQMHWCLEHDTPGIAGDLGDCWAKGSNEEPCTYELLLVQIPKGHEKSDGISLH